MTRMQIAESELWIIRALLLYGVLVAAWFLGTWWPRVTSSKRFTLPALDVGGWVGAFFIIYTVLLIDGLVRPTPSDRLADDIADVTLVRSALLVLLIVVNAALTVRLLHWRRIRRNGSSRRGHPPDEVQTLENPL
jgi:hypothetical protein